MEVLREFVDSYVVPEVKEEIVADAPAVVEEEEEPVADDSCSTANCKRKGKSDCIHKMCFPCCYATKEANAECGSCAGHYYFFKKKEDEERLIAMGLSSLSKNKTNFYHFEDKFMNFGETVVLWSFQDFCNNPKFSSDTFEQYKRQERQRLMLLKRSRLEGEDVPPLEDGVASPVRGLKRTVNDVSSSTLNSPVNASPSKAARGKRSARTPNVVESESSSTLTSAGDKPAGSPKKRARPSKAAAAASVDSGDIEIKEEDNSGDVEVVSKSICNVV